MTVYVCSKRKNTVLGSSLWPVRASIFHLFFYQFSKLLLKQHVVLISVFNVSKWSNAFEIECSQFQFRPYIWNELQYTFRLKSLISPFLRENVNLPKNFDKNHIYFFTCQTIKTLVAGICVFGGFKIFPFLLP